MVAAAGVGVEEGGEAVVDAVVVGEVGVGVVDAEEEEEEAGLTPVRSRGSSRSRAPRSPSTKDFSCPRRG